MTTNVHEIIASRINHKRRVLQGQHSKLEILIDREQWDHAEKVAGFCCELKREIADLEDVSSLPDWQIVSFLAAA